MIFEKVVGMMDGACDAFSRYVQIAELLHRPWAMMSWILTLLWNARVAPDRLKEWKPCPVAEIPFSKHPGCECQ